jgi:hypothetical protein
MAARHSIITGLTVFVTILGTLRAQSQIQTTAFQFAEEFLSDSSVWTDSSDLELMRDPDYGEEQYVAVAFRLNVPQGAIISQAAVQFTCKESARSFGKVVVRVEVEASVTPSNLVAGYYNVSTRPMTNAWVDWSPPTWRVVNEAGPNERTPDISVLLQNLVMQPSWAANRTVLITFRRSPVDTGYNLRIAYSGLISFGTPVLLGNYTTGGECDPTVVQKVWPSYFAREALSLVLTLSHLPTPFFCCCQ